MSNYAEATIARTYMKKQRKNLVILFEDTPIGWDWDEDELELLAEMNDFGNSIEEMNQVFKREDPDEIFLALFYLAKKGRIERINVGRLKG